MNGTANIITKISRFDECQQAGLERLGAFRDLDAYSVPGNAQDAEPPKTYEQGLEDGRLQAEQSACDLSVFATALEQSILNIKDEIETSHRRVVLALLQAGLPALADKNLAGEISEFIVSLSAFSLDGQIELRVHPGYEVTLSDIVQSTKKPSIFTIQPDENVPAQAVHAVWDNGGAKIDIKGVLQKLLNRIEQKYSETNSQEN
ncbi:MAG: hypothetical protein L3J65_00095 [Robiginitomaculum sp.]|nr:hypothetical protein [Robiginitomaculum sp.]